MGYSKSHGIHIFPKILSHPNPSHGMGWETHGITDIVRPIAHHWSGSAAAKNAAGMMLFKKTKLSVDFPDGCSFYKKLLLIMLSVLIEGESTFKIKLCCC